MRNALGVNVVGGRSLELVYWRRGGSARDPKVPNNSVLKIELIAETSVDGEASSSGGGGAAAGAAKAATGTGGSAGTSSNTSRTATPTPTPTSTPTENNSHSILRAVHTPPLLDPATGHPFDFTALCGEVSIPLLLDKAMQLQTHNQLKRIHTELLEAASAADDTAPAPNTATPTSSAAAGNGGVGGGAAAEGNAGSAEDVGDELAARNVAFEFREGLTADHSEVSRLVITFKGSSQSPASPTEASPISIILTYNARGFWFYEECRRKCTSVHPPQRARGHGFGATRSLKQTTRVLLIGGTLLAHALTTTVLMTSYIQSSTWRGMEA